MLQHTFLIRATRTACAAAVPAPAVPAARNFATVPPVNIGARNHKVIVVGGGSAGLAVSHQLLRSGRFAQDDIAVVDPATWHHYQPGWTLVGGGVKRREDLRRQMKDLVAPKLKLYNNSVYSFSPHDNIITLGSGDKLSYEQLVVVPGINIEYDKIRGLQEALSTPDTPVSSIYGYDTCIRVFPNIQKLKQGTAIFTQPAGVVKCAGAPQKIMWLALDHWKKAGLYNLNNAHGSGIQISFATGLPVMFGVPKYSAALEKLRTERGVEGLFQHDLVAIEGNIATFTRLDSEEQVRRQFDFLHVVPKMAPHEFVKNSLLANDAGFVDVDQETTQHKRYHNVWSIGDASSLATSKTAAAITAQAPVLAHNVLKVLDNGAPGMMYNGYTCCPLTTEYGKVLLAEFKYGGEPDETFRKWFGIGQETPRRLFYYLKRDFFPWVYYKSMVKGTWAGTSGWLR